MKSMWMVRAGQGASYIDDFIEKNVVAVGWSNHDEIQVGDSMNLAGIDLAWHSENNPSAIAYGELTDSVLSVTSIDTTVYGVDQVIDRLKSFSGLSPLVWGGINRAKILANPIFAIVLYVSSRHISVGLEKFIKIVINGLSIYCYFSKCWFLRIRIFRCISFSYGVIHIIRAGETTKLN
ncbi:MAG: hypothetical protein GY820_43655 [Gammaproteobacteria bacterium]|nr:hypothetical protein [Gammaproteobacteria bacterium]